MAQHPFTLAAPIPSILWSSLEDVLSTNMRLFAKDIAKTLGRPEAPLLQALNAEKIRPYIFEPSEEVKEIDMCCSVMCAKPEAPLFLQRCGHPIVWSSKVQRCMEHQSHVATPHTSALPVVHRLEHPTPLYCAEDSTVYSTENVPVGYYAGNVLTLFEVDEGE
jgi:hypothetical protein